MDITYLIDQLHVVDSAGQLKLKQLCFEEYQRLNECVLWRTDRGQLNLIKNVTFGDVEYKGKARSENTMTFTGSELFDYELKALAILYHKIGYIEGDYGFRWSTTIGVLTPLKKLALFLSERNYDSFRQFNQVHPIMQRNLINSFLLANGSENGLDLRGVASARKQILDSLPVIHRYGLFSDDTAASFYDVINTIPNFETEDYSTSHPVIPTRILKQVIQQSKDRIDEAERLIPEWEKANGRLISRLIEGKPKFSKLIDNTASAVIRRYMSSHHNSNKELKAELDRLYETFKYFRVDVYVQVLAFTGMRNQEVAALKNDAAKSRDDRFYIQSVLSKTAPSGMNLNWVTNADACRAVRILSRFNKSILKRAQVLLEYHREVMTQELIYHLEDGIKQNRLFGVLPSKSAVRFTDNCKLTTRSNSPGKDGKFNLNEYRFELSECDLQQLDMMNCNYKGMSGTRRRTQYREGEKFNITPHQFRHTFAWFIVANRLGDLDDVKYQFKHLSSSMSMVYSHRGYETIEELVDIIEGFDAQVTEKLATELASKAQVRRLSGGGGQRWVKAAEALQISVTNIGMENNDKAILTKKKTLHFRDIDQYKAFLVKHLKGVRGLPHGLCIGGEDCKIKNAAVPTGCVLCGNYLVSERHLPHWKAMESYALNKLNIFERATPEQQAPYQLLADSWRATLQSARMIIEQVETGRNKRFQKVGL
ncbi:phage integrase family protein [Vibrio fortis]|uniref:Phage integrase family protein n=1 Tax=Vibrio fortis TaxID=212667 RepID=A0A5N3QXX2_9VIBR|nr:tyrosine-type recombinase/integrase [Vibrio fortis]KAB0287058.1 phage integrase family protein [Vibrio fortis]